MTTHIHCFGCSFTAGDEVSDDTWFPWKFTEQHTAESYYKKRNQYFADNPDSAKQYRDENKKFAYPALIKLDDVIVYNQSRNGKSLRENVFEIVARLEHGSQMNAVFLQIPPPGREMYMLDDGDLMSFQYSSLNETDAWYEYNLAKQKTHNYRQNSLEDLLDILMIAGYLKSKNVYFKLIVIGSELDSRFQDIEEIGRYKALVDSVKKLPIIELRAQTADRLLGTHLTKEFHKTLASIIESDICQNIISK